MSNPSLKDLNLSPIELKKHQKVLLKHQKLKIKQ